MTRYIVTVPNPQYAGKAAGVRFNGGRAVVDFLTIDNSLGRTLDETIQIFKDLGYTIQEVNEQGQGHAPAMIPLPSKKPTTRKKQPA